jgi:hypothetical protein
MYIEQALPITTMPYLIERLCEKQGLSIDEAEELVTSMKQFLVLAAIKPDTTTYALSPTAVIDEAWHQFLLYTAHYRDFCQTYIGFFVDHQPWDMAMRLIKKAQNKRFLDVEQTIALANEVYGASNLSQYWALDPSICGHSKSCSSCDAPGR